MVNERQGIGVERRVALIVLSTALACLLLYVVEQVLGVNYLVKTLVKLVLFAGIPWGYAWLTDSTPQVGECRVRRGLRMLPASLKLGLFLGAATFGAIFLAYFLFQSALDLPAIARELQEKSRITPSNFLLVGAYVTFGNSLLEEWFFRGFVFLTLHRLGWSRLAYGYSSLLFALYHIAIFRTWFSPGLMILALLGLVTIGLIFDWLNAKTDHFLSSWLTHVLADTAIILIGLRLMGMA